MLQALIPLIYLKFIVFNTHVDKLDIDKLINVPTVLKNLKRKVDYLDIDKLKTVPEDLNELSDVVSRGC